MTDLTETLAHQLASEGEDAAVLAAQDPPPRRRPGARLGAIVVVIVGFFFVAPALIVIPMSFSESTTFQFPPKGFTLRLYERFFTVTDSPATNWLGSLGHSVLVAILVAILATLCGTAAAIGLDRLPGRLPRLVRTLMMLPLVAPSIVVAVDIYVTYLQWHLVGTIQGYVFAHTAIALPFVIVSVTASLGGFDRGLLRASASLGASPWRSFLTVTAPLISRGIITGAVFAFVTSFDEVVIALFIRSPQFQTLPVQMYNAVTSEIDPTIAAAASLIVVIVTIIFLAPQLIGGRKRAR